MILKRVVWFTWINLSSRTFFVCSANFLYSWRLLRRSFSAASSSAKKSSSKSWKQMKSVLALKQWAILLSARIWFLTWAYIFIVPFCQHICTLKVRKGGGGGYPIWYFLGLWSTAENLWVSNAIKSYLRLHKQGSVWHQRVYRDCHFAHEGHIDIVLMSILTL